MISSLLHVILLLICVCSYSNAAKCLNTGSNYVTIQSEKQLESNGCSVPAFVQLPPDAPDFTSCCHLHDACYSICQETQVHCDNDFNKCMKALCKTENPADPKSCLETANMFHMGVSMFGGQGFQDTQNDYCSCIKKNKAETHYTNILTNFYSKYTDKKPTSALEATIDITGSTTDTDTGTGTGATPTPTVIDNLPDSIRKNITQYALEHTGYKKFNKLYYKLHKKYPKSFKYIEKPI